MKQPLSCILLVDDDPDDNFIHKRLINKAGLAQQVSVAENGLAALEYLRKIDAEDGQPYCRPDIIFLDINMPKLDGWGFLDAYDQLDEQLKADVVVAMLTTSLNPDDYNRAMSCRDVRAYKTKPLTMEMLTELVGEFFPDRM